MKHTPGPWQTIADNNRSMRDILASLGLTPSEGRFGNCDTVAWAFAVSGDKVGESRTHAHFFVLHDGLYFDATHPDGVPKLSTLFGGNHPGRVVYWSVQ